MPLIIFDTEYTSWKGCQEKGWVGNQKREIVQISALKVSSDLDVISEFNLVCKPVINPVLSDYFVDLTHITQAQIENHGVKFAEAYEKFETFVADCVCYSHGWGKDYFNASDGAILEENLKLYNVLKHKNIVYRNIAPIFKQLYTTNGINVESQASGQIVEILKLKQNLKKINLAPHNSLYDVYSILEGLKYFYPYSMDLISFWEKQS